MEDSSMTDSSLSVQRTVAKTDILGAAFDRVLPFQLALEIEEGCGESRAERRRFASSCSVPPTAGEATSSVLGAADGGGGPSSTGGGVLLARGSLAYQQVAKTIHELVFHGEGCGLLDPSTVGQDVAVKVLVHPKSMLPAVLEILHREVQECEAVVERWKRKPTALTEGEEITPGRLSLAAGEASTATLCLTAWRGLTATTNFGLGFYHKRSFHTSNARMSKILRYSWPTRLRELVMRADSNSSHVLHASTSRLQRLVHDMLITSEPSGENELKKEVVDSLQHTSVREEDGHLCILDWGPRTRWEEVCDKVALLWRSRVQRYVGEKGCLEKGKLNESSPILLVRIVANNVNKLDVRRYLKVWTSDVTQSILDGVDKEGDVHDGEEGEDKAEQIAPSSQMATSIKDKTQLSIVHLLSERPLERTLILSWEPGEQSGR